MSSMQFEARTNSGRDAEGPRRKGGTSRLLTGHESGFSRSAMAASLTGPTMADPSWYPAVMGQPKKTPQPM